MGGRKEPGGNTLAKRQRRCRQRSSEPDGNVAWEALEPRLLLSGGDFGALAGRNVKLTLADPAGDGTQVTFSLAGGGTGTVVDTANGWDVSVLGSTARSALTITARKSRTPGDDGKVTLHTITVGNWADDQDATPIKSISGANVSINGRVNVTGTLASLTLDDIRGPWSGVNILGTGLPNGAPEIALLGLAGAPIADGDATPSPEDGTDLGSTHLAGGQVTRTFSIQNTGSAALELDGTPRISLGGPAGDDFHVTVIPAATVAAGGATTFEITFDPSAAGLRTATVTIANNDSNEDPYNFTIQGTGTEYQIVDVVADFQAYYDQCQGLSVAQRQAQWDTMLYDKNPDFFDQVLYRNLTGDDLTQYKDVIFNTYWNDLAGRMGQIAQTSATAEENVAAIVADFKRSFPTFNPASKFYMTISFSFNGKVAPVNGTDVLALGLENFQPNSEQLRITIAHELFHLYHSPTYSVIGALYRPLWEEGMATYVSSIIVPGYRDSVYLGFDATKMNQCAGQLAQLAADLRTNLYSTDAPLRRAYFGVEDNALGIPPAAGYYVGYRIMQRLTETQTIDSLSRLSPIDSQPILTEALQWLENA